MENKKIKIGLIGCGAIGSEIAQAIDTEFSAGGGSAFGGKDSAELIGISDIDKEKAKCLQKKLRSKPTILPIDALIKKSDLIIEAASAKVSGLIAKKAILAKKDIMIMSTGGIIKNYTAIFNLAKKNNCKVYLPSGAICGLDGVKAALLGKIKKVELITRKPAGALAGAPFVTKNNIDLNKINTETVIFEGNAEEAIEGFPANINVACTLSMAGIGPKKTKVKIIASPLSTKNMHEIVLEGGFGRIVAKTENVPSPDNPKTSYLAVLSAIATLRQILEPIKIGT